jgi:hypothetical protein
MKDFKQKLPTDRAKETKISRFGINAIKSILTVIAGIVRDSFTIDSNKDDNISLGEILSFATSQVFKSAGVLSDLNNFKDEVKDLDDSEIAELVDYVQTLDFLPPSKDAAERFIKDVVNFINYNYRFTKKSVVFFQSIRKVAA